jgi:hypothetical protein
MFFLLCIVIKLCNAYTNGLPDDGTHDVQNMKKTWRIEFKKLI